MTGPQPTARYGTEPLRRWDPERIGPYAILGRLGAGGMGQVYMGRSAAGRLVAVKTIRVELADTPGFRARFAREVAAARRVSGVFTAAVVEADPDADLPWLATAYVPAPSLARLVKACGPLPVSTIRWLAAGCAEALESIHGAGLVHRDLKPSNVLVAPDGPRVIDFGVARAAERMGVTMTRGHVGTPAYIAPEQARDDHQTSPASDVYALGATLLFAATGHPPYQGDSVMDVLVRLATEEPDLSGLSADLTALITACLQRVPRERPTSSAVLAELAHFTGTQPGMAEDHAYLSDTAMALITQYQRNPLPVQDQPDEEYSDATSGSYTALPGFSEAHPPGNAEPGGRWRWVRKRMAWIRWVSAGAALVAAGIILGAWLMGQGSPGTTANNTLPASVTSPPVPPETRCGPVEHTVPALCMSRPEGGPSDSYTVQGSGFTPGTFASVSLTWNSPPQSTIGSNGYSTANKPIAVGQGGAFQFTLSQLFPGGLQLGYYQVRVIASNGDVAETEFVVVPSQMPHGQG